MATDKSKRILLVEDSVSEARIYEQYMRSKGLTVTHVDTAAGAMSALGNELPSVLLLDLNLPDGSGFEILDYVQSNSLPVTTIVVTGEGSIKTAVKAMQSGAFDFVVKPFNKDRLIITVRNALERHDLAEIVDTYKNEFDRTHYHGFIGESHVMQGVYRTIDAAARSTATVFIKGESGTGKEVCADALHRQSKRATGPFVPINCAAIPSNLMESEIFGHVKGAFTGATSDRDGAAIQANTGTLFLDEICEMDLDLQAKLLRFIQTGIVQKVGGSKGQKVDVRFVCATNRDPWEEVQSGRFREDLYYRLHVIPIGLPALRERDGDPVLIARAFLERFTKEEQKPITGFSRETEIALGQYTWPGNVRQLQNVIRNLVIFCTTDEITVDQLPPELLGQASPASSPAPFQSPRQDPVRAPVAAPTQAAGAGEPVAPGGIEPLWITEKRTIERAIDICGGNVPRAAAFLEISPSTIYRKKLAWQAQGQG